MITEPLTCRDAFDGWYVIEKKHHDGQHWFEPITGFPNSKSLRCSSRIGTSDIEGTREHMLGIANAVKNDESYYAKRCAVRPVDGGFEMWSPRNEHGEPPVVATDVAIALADEILERVRAQGGDHEPK